MANPGPAIQTTINTQSPRSTAGGFFVLAVSMTPVSVTTTTTAEQSFGLNGVTQATAATGILPGDVIVAVNPPSLTANTFIAGARVDTAVADKFYVEFGALTTATPASGTWLITVYRPNASTLGEAAVGSYSTFPTSVPSN